MAIERDVTATLRTRRAGDTTAFKAAADEVKRFGASTSKAGTEAQQASRKVDRLEQESRQLRSALRHAQADLRRFEQSGKGIDRLAGSFARLRDVLKGLVILEISQRLRDAVTIIADFAEQMSKVGAVSQATDKELAALVARARELGATTKYSATEVASGMEDLARAGLKPGEVLLAVGHNLDLAASSATEFSTAADIATNVLASFGLAITDFQDVVDTLFTTTAKSNTAVISLGESIKEVGALAAGVGEGLHDVSAIMGVLGNSALKGTNAGNALKAVIASLEGATPKAEKALARMGLTLDDVRPSTNALIDVIDLLGRKNLSVGDAFTIFGRRGANAIMVLTKNIDQVKALREEIDRGGDSAKAAGQKMADNLGGDLKSLESALQEATLAAGDAGLGPALRELTQGITEAVRSADSIKGLGQVIGSLITILDGAITVFVGTLSTIKNAIYATVGEIGEGWGKLFGDEEFSQKAAAFGDEAQKNIIGGLDRLQKRLQSKVETLDKIWSDAAEGPAEAADQISQAVDNIDLSPLETLEIQYRSFLESFGEAAPKDLTPKAMAELGQQARQLVAEFEKLGQQVPAELRGITTALEDGTAGWRKAIAGLQPEKIRLLPEDVQEQVRAKFAEMVNAIKAAGGAIGPEIQAIGNQLGVLVAQFDPVAAGIKSAAEAVEEGGQRMAAAADGPRDVTAQVQAMVDAMRATRDESAGAATGVEDLAQRAGTAAPKIKEGADAAAQAAASYETAGETIAESGRRMGEAADGPRDLTQEVRAMADALRAGRSESAEAAEGLERMAESAGDAGPKIEAGAEAAGKAAEGFKAAATDVGAGTEALAEHATAAEVAGEGLTGAKDAAENLAGAEKEAKKSVEELSSELGQAASSITTLTTDLGAAGEEMQSAFSGLGDLTAPLNAALEATLMLVTQLGAKTRELTAEFQRLGNSVPG